MSTEPELNRLRFDYVNWRGEDHHYLIVPEPTITYQPTNGEGTAREWHLHGEVVARDGKLKPGRRSFVLRKMRNVTAA